MASTSKRPRKRVISPIDSYTSEYSDPIWKMKRVETRRKNNFKRTQNAIVRSGSSDSISDTFDPLEQSKQAFNRLSYVNRSKQKVNNVEDARQHKAINSGNERNIRNKQDEIAKLKYCVMKVIKEITQTFSTFLMQINNLQSKYLTVDPLKQQDAADMIFLLNCIISKLKEELTVQQQECTNFYLQQNKKNNCDRTTLNTQNVRETNNNNVQSRNSLYSVQQISSESSSINKVLYTNICRRSSPGCYVKPKNTISRSSIKINISDSLSDESSTMFDITEHNDTPENSRNLSSILGKLKEIDVIKRPVKRSVAESGVTKNASRPQTLSQVHRQVCKQPHETKQNPSIKKNVKQTTLPDCDRDINSSCTTISVCHSKSKTIELNNEDTDNVTNNGSSSKALVEDLLNESQDFLNESKDLHNFDLDQTTNMPRCSTPIISTETVNHETSTFESWFEDISNVDKKLKMKCQVLIDKMTNA